MYILIVIYWLLSEKLAYLSLLLYNIITIIMIITTIIAIID